MHEGSGRRGKMAVQGNRDQVIKPVFTPLFHLAVLDTVLGTDFGWLPRKPHVGFIDAEASPHGARKIMDLKRRLHIPCTTIGGQVPKHEPDHTLLADQ